MAVGQSVSNRRAVRSSHADSCARRHGAVPLRSVAEVVNGDPGRSGHLGRHARHNTIRTHRWLPGLLPRSWSTASSPTPLSVPLVSQNVFAGRSSLRATGNSQAKRSYLYIVTKLLRKAS